MCNLLRYKDKTERVRQEFDEIRQVRITPKLNYKVAPSEPAPVLSHQRDGLEIGMMSFGFRTHRGRQLMARGETVAKLPMFRDAFQRRRCLVLAHGFYDSENLGQWRQPWHLHLKDDELMPMAALWSAEPEGTAFTLVSAPANRVVARVIDRMPVILPQPLWRRWMHPDTASDDLQAMLQPLPPEHMEAYPVTRDVNRPGFNSPDCITPVIPAQGDLGLF
jgi:putative SOS response-associated peptidase YedK